MTFLSFMLWAVAYLVVGAIYGCTCRTMGWTAFKAERYWKVEDAADMGRIMLLWPLATLGNLVYLMLTALYSLILIPEATLWLCDNSKVWCRGSKTWYREWRRTRRNSHE